MQRHNIYKTTFFGGIFLKIKNFALVFATFLLMFAMPVSANTFSDVGESDWFHDSVMAGVEHGYINGFDDGSFKPTDNVTYGEFYKMLAEAFKIETEEIEKPYHWSQKYSRALFQNGDKNIQTNPIWFDADISRKEVIRNVVYVAGDITNVVSAKYYNEKTFNDMPLPTIYNYDGYIMIAKKAGVVMGDDNGNVNPDQKITRAEAVAIIERALAVENWEVEEPDVLNGLNIRYSGKYTDSFKESLCAGISKYPKEIIDGFIKNGGKILVTDENPDNYYITDSEISGLYMPNENKIVLFTNGQSASFFFDLTGTLIHELGHYVYHEVVSAADKREINRIFKEGIEPKNLSEMTFDNYGEKNVDEFFAELVCYQLSSKLTYKEGDISQSLAIVGKYIPEYIYTK